MKRPVPLSEVRERLDRVAGRLRGDPALTVRTAGMLAGEIPAEGVGMVEAKDERSVRVPAALLDRAKALAPVLREDALVRAAGTRLSTAAAVRLLLLRGIEATEAKKRVR